MPSTTHTVTPLRRNRCRTTARPTLWVVVLASSALLGACRDPLYITGDPRSQYDRTAELRDRKAPDFIYDEFGTRRPNIRGRLLGAE